MKCAGISSPFASLMKPESIGCWISACTSVVSPLLVARTRMVDAMISCPYLFLRMILSENRVPLFWIRRESAAAAADADFDCLGGAVELAAGLHDRDHVAGLGHLQPIGNGRHC